MGYGSTGRILRVDLTGGTVAVEEFGEEVYRRYPGGRALAAYLLFERCPLERILSVQAMCWSLPMAC